jgi:hypothetical protein
MTAQGCIQPIPATAELWQQLAAAKQRGDYVEVGRLSDTIRRETIRERAG